MTIKEKYKEVIEQLQKALEAGKEARVSGEISISIKMHEGGIRNAQVTVQRQIV